MGFMNLFRRGEKSLEELQSELDSISERTARMREDRVHLQQLGGTSAGRPFKGYGDLPKRRRYRGLRGKFVDELQEAESPEEKLEVVAHFVSKLSHGGYGYTREAAERKVVGWFKEEVQDGTS